MRGGGGGGGGGWGVTRGLLKGMKDINLCLKQLPQPQPAKVIDITF